MATPEAEKQPLAGAGGAYSGLTDAEAARRLQELGPNTIPQARPPHLVQRVLAQLRDPMILLLMVAGVVTTLTHDLTDTAIIAAVVLLNTTLGVVQEWRADRAVRALDRLAAPWAAVRRGGVRRRAPARDVVPGDLLVVEAGDIVAADATLVEAHTLQVDEAAITGESVPRECAPGDPIEAGTVVTRGRGLATVTRTGAASGLGRIAGLVAATPVRRTPLQRRLNRLSGSLVVTVSALATLVLVLGLLRGRSLAEMTVVALSLAVAAVPESLPAVVSISLALGAHRMARRHAVVRRLPAVETLGSVTVLASDKTGTLTEGRMTVEGLWTPGSSGLLSPSRDAAGPEARELVRDLLLCNDAQTVRHTDAGGSRAATVGDPIEQALLDLAPAFELDVEAVRRLWPRVDERPFDARVRTMSTLHHVGDRWRVICKGAPEAVLELVDDPAVAERIFRVSGRAAEAGHRVLAVASRDSEHPLSLNGDGLRITGLVALHDPLRSSAREVVRSLTGAGVRMVLVTGDHSATGRSVADRLGLLEDTPDVVEGPELEQALAGDRARRVGGFARIRQEQKVDIVRHLQDLGDVVAMTGDGVNDAPALRTADIGVAMGVSGTEVARQAASLVLADDELRTVVAAVEEGRRIYANIRTFLRYGLAGGFAEVAVMLVAPFLGMPVPLVAAQILWINMLTHGLPGVAFGAEPADPRNMRRPSRSPQDSILGDGLLRQIFVAGSLIAAGSVVAGLLAPRLGAHTQTSIFVALGVGQLSVAWALRSRVRPRRIRDRAVEAAVLSALGLQLLAVYLSPLRELLGTSALSISALLPVMAVGVVPGIAVHLTGRSTLARHDLDRAERLPNQSTAR